MSLIQETSTCSPVHDNLFAGTQVQPVVADAVTIRAGQGRLPVGAVLGEVTSANSGTATAGVGNTGNATISTVAVSNDATTGTYSVVVTAAIDGTTPAAFTVTGPGGATANGSMGAEFNALGITFTITDAVAPSTPAAVDDSWSIAVVEGKGEYVLCNSASNDGSQQIVCILAEAVDATDSDVASAAYFSGEFNTNSLTFGGSDTAETHRIAARKVGIYFKENAGA